MKERDIRRGNHLGMELKQIKYLEDSVWGNEMGNWKWSEPLEHYQELLEKFPNEVITVSRNEKLNLVEGSQDRIVGLAIIAPLNESKFASVEEMIQKERDLDSFNYWTEDKTDLFNFYIVMVDKTYRNTTVIKELMSKVGKYFYGHLKESRVYATGVTEDGHKLLSKYGCVIAEKEENRKVYKLDVNKLVKGYYEAV